MKRILFLVLLIFTRLLNDVQVVSAQLSKQTQVSSGNQQIMRTLNYLYESGKEGYNTFRIPAVITTGKGIILAFAEGRKNSGSDTGDIDLVMKSSEDNGKTWSKLLPIWDDAQNVCGNPAPVQDKKTGTIYLLSTWNLGTDHESEIIRQTSKDTRRVYILHSDDNGKSWSKPSEITKLVKQDNWTWYATGPGHGIQLETGKYKGRLIIPCDHIESVTNRYYSHIIYSDDHGITWKIGGSTPQDQVNECTVAELPDGRLILNMRNYDRSRTAREISISNDGGLSWSDIHPDPVLVEPLCQAGILRYSDIKSRKSKLLFLNPADIKKRENMTIRLSLDNGLSWPEMKVLFPGPSAYSDLTRQKDGKIGCFFEAGLTSAYQGIVYRIISLNEIKEK